MKLRAGIIGLGVGEQHIAGYESHPNCEVVALCDLAEEKLARAAQLYPGKRLVRQAEEILRDPSIDVVSIASYDNFHYSQVLEAIAHNKHIFVEKPLCLTEEEHAHIHAEWSKKPSLRLSSNLILRMSPRFLRLRERLQRGELGEVFHIEGDYNYGRLHKIHQGWRGEIDYYSVVLGGAIHLVDLMLWLTGKKVVEVCAYGNGISSRGSQFRYHDMTSALLRFADGLTGKVSSNYACVYPHFHRLSVYGTQATFENGLEHALLFRERDAKSAEIITDPYPGTRKGDLIYSFIESILTKQAAIVPTADVFDVMSVCLAIERSIAEGRNLPVAYH